MGSHEAVIQIKQNKQQHWFLKGIDNKEFTVESKNQWDPHPFNITKKNIEQVQACHQVIAESLKGPSIAEHFNTIAC
jgi:formate-dependent phosphoribosylglycinamide formyltransferase (GAR transformylase)